MEESGQRRNLRLPDSGEGMGVKTVNDEEAEEE